MGVSVSSLIICDRRLNGRFVPAALAATRLLLYKKSKLSYGNGKKQGIFWCR